MKWPNYLSFWKICESIIFYIAVVNGMIVWRCHGNRVLSTRIFHIFLSEVGLCLPVISHMWAWWLKCFGLLMLHNGLLTKKDLIWRIWNAWASECVCISALEPAYLSSVVAVINQHELLGVVWESNMQIFRSAIWGSGFLCFLLVVLQIWGAEWE